LSQLILVEPLVLPPAIQNEEKHNAEFARQSVVMAQDLESQLTVIDQAEL
jgi:hypothetical protein